MRSVGLLRSGGEDLALDLLDVLAEAGDRRAVVVDDTVDDRVQHGSGAVREPLGVGLQGRPYAVQLAGLAVANGDDEVAALERHLL
jgi:hypothetical protein